MSKRRPPNISAPHDARQLGIDWNDGESSTIPHEILRGYCPCATCQGHSGKIAFPGGGDLELVELATVGNYAIRLTWGDRHGSGLYSYDFLHALAAWHDEHGAQMTQLLPELPSPSP